MPADADACSALEFAHEPHAECAFEDVSLAEVVEVAGEDASSDICVGLLVEADTEKERALLVAREEEDIDSCAGLGSVVTERADGVRERGLSQHEWIDVEVVE